MGIQYLIPFDFKRPPLTLNQRLSWPARAGITKALKTAAVAKMQHIGPLNRVRCTLIWHVTDKRRRDVDNIVPTLKVLCDAVVVAGIVPDDTPEFMDQVMPSIQLIDKEYGPASFSFTIEEI